MDAPSKIEQMAAQMTSQASTPAVAPEPATTASAPAVASATTPKPVQPASPEAEDIAKLRRERDRYVAFAFCASDVLVELDADGAVAAVAGAIAALVHADFKKLKGQHFLDLVDPRDRHRGDVLMQSFRSGKRSEPEIVRLIHHGEEGGSVPFAITGCWLSELGGHYFLAMRRTAAAVPKVARRKIESVVKSEPIGELLEADEFTKRMADKLRRLKSDGEDGKLSLLKLDKLDALESRLNDATRAELKKRITAILQEGAAEGALAGSFGEGRYGVVLDRDVGSKDISSRISGMAETIDPEGKGIEMKSAELDTRDIDLRDADAMNLLSYSVNSFAAATEGGMTIDDLQNGLTEVMGRNGRLMNAVRRVIKDRRFQPHFQPIVHLASRSCSHYEALSRVTDAALEIAPQEFILFCEQTSLIREFDLAMVRKNIDILDGLGRSGENLRIAVNLSGPSLDDQAFRDELKGILATSEVPSELMLFEITESSALADPAQTNLYIQELRAAGYKVCLDDFGAGAASLEYLRELEIDVVKIDGSYVRNSLKTEKGAVLFRSMVQMCKELKLKTVAEMVEDEADVAFLTKTGVDYGQGWYFGRPAPEIPNYSTGLDRPVVAHRRGEVESWG